jgi:hypothetical protein
MSAEASKGFRIWEWAALLGLAVVAEAVAQLAGLNQRWEEAIVYTVVLFAVLTLALRPAWDRKVFWASLAAIFVLHSIALVVVEYSFPSAMQGFHGFPRTIVAMAEGLLIAGVLWRSSMGRVPRR